MAKWYKNKIQPSEQQWICISEILNNFHYVTKDIHSSVLSMLLK